MLPVTVIAVGQLKEKYFKDAAEEYKQQCISSGFKNVSYFETGIYKNPPEIDDFQDDADDEE